MPRTVRAASVLAVLAAAAACGPSAAERAAQEARAALEESRAALAAAESRTRAAEDARAAAEASLNASRAIAEERVAAAAKEAAEAAEKTKKDLERVEAHRDEMRDWIEEDLLPLAEKQSPELANLRDATAEMMKEVAQIRGLEWKHPVMRRRIRRAQVGEWMRRDLKKELPEEKAKEIVQVGVEMGLVPEGTDIYAIFSDFLEAGAAAFYKPDTRTFYHIEGNDGRGAYPIVFHELVHAVEDQHFDLDAFYRAVEGDSDAALARRGLCEGSAALFQDLYQAKHPKDVADMMKAQATPEMMQKQVRMAQKVPAFLIASMGLYPYNNGKVWLRRATGGDPTKVGALYADPPVSTEQVLHPERYVDPQKRDWPHKVAAPDLSAALPGWKALDSDTMGELVTGCVLAQLRFKGMAAFLAVMDMGTQGFGLKEPARSAVEGWDGDRYSAAMDPATGRATVAWVTMWDREVDATEFVEAYGVLIGKRVTRAEVKELPDPAIFTEPGTGRVTALVRDGRRVTIVLGAPEDRYDAVLAAALAAPVTADPRDRADAR